MSKQPTPTNGPTPWSLGGDAPEPQTVETRKPVDLDDFSPADTHTGTDVLGRAIGPREDHLAVKKVIDENGDVRAPYTVTVDDDGKVKRKPVPTTAAVTRAKKTAEATDTEPEAVDDPKPYTPTEVAQAHASGDVLAPKEA